LFYGNQTSDSILFKDQLDDLKDRFLDRLAIFHVLSRERQELEVLNGRLAALVDVVERFGSVRRAQGT
jgi:ring-1,2-phenylacetyl-CoA epoxidase subunit PaaE